MKQPVISDLIRAGLDFLQHMSLKFPSLDQNKVKVIKSKMANERLRETDSSL